MGDPIEDRTHFSRLHSVSPRKVSKKSPDYLLEVSTSIQRRDRDICLALYDHRVLTTHHIKELFFENDRVCRRRLAKLRELGLVKPFRPRAARGSYPHHYILGDLGVYLVAAELGVDAKALGLRKDRMTKIAFSPKLRHQLEVNSFFSRLAWACRHHPQTRLLQWRSELQLARRHKDIHAYPDSEGRVRSGRHETWFFLELDRATESPQRIDGKLYDYPLLRGIYEYRHWILFCVPDVAREAAIRRVLEVSHLPTATVAYGRHMADPLGPIWLPIRSEDRLSLTALPEPGGPTFESNRGTSDKS